MWKCPHCGNSEPLDFQRGHMKLCSASQKKSDELLDLIMEDQDLYDERKCKDFLKFLTMVRVKISVATDLK